MEEEFIKISNEILNTDIHIDDTDKLILYGYFKQTTLGNCTEKLPPMFDLKAKAKYNAWKENNGMDKNIAMQRYIRKAKILLGTCVKK